MAIIFLPKKAPTNRYIKLVTLPSPDYEETILTGLTGEVSGWGQTLNSTENQEILRWTEVTIIPNSICQMYYEENRITSKILCATNNYAGFCHGDHGGPLVIDSDGELLQVGVASFCHRTCTDETPGAYSKVTAYMEWITRTAEIRDD
ncbi:chymotrypsinogen B-like [Schistocerca americana]|uniref:chymotrypsinogen B-like n=1 Tax=Schistocerca americana TaxID=7009 RepID=UPI001F4F5293|nr:chymotrypsinogen B-like [Schistocerca americana]